MAVHSSDDFYGADRMLLHVLEAAARQHDDVTVVLPSDLPAKRGGLGETLSSAGQCRVVRTKVPVLRRADLSAPGLVRIWLAVLKWVPILRRERPHTVFLATSAILPLVVACRLAGVPKVILHKQELWRGGQQARLLALMSRWCDAIVCISTPVKAELPEALAHKAHVVLNCVRLPDAVSALPRIDGLHFLVASRWNAWKGHATLLSAWDQLGATHHRLTVLGGPPASGQAVDVRALVSSLAHPETVTILGEVPAIDDWIDRVHVVVVPSDLAEPFGLIAAEAIVRGRPVLASRAGGLADIVEPGENGWTFAPQDVDGLAQILSSLSEDDVRRAAARCLEAAPQYDPALYVEQMIRLLR